MICKIIKKDNEPMKFELCDSVCYDNPDVLSGTCVSYKEGWDDGRPVVTLVPAGELTVYCEQTEVKDERTDEGKQKDAQIEAVKALAERKAVIEPNGDGDSVVVRGDGWISAADRVEWVQKAPLIELHLLKAGVLMGIIQVGSCSVDPKIQALVTEMPKEQPKEQAVSIEPAPEVPADDEPEPVLESKCECTKTKPKRTTKRKASK